MRRIGYYAGPGPTGAFTDRTAAFKAYVESVRGEAIAFTDLYTITLDGTLGAPNTATGRTVGLTFRFTTVDYDVPFEGLVYAGGGWRRRGRVGFLLNLAPNLV